MGSCVSRPTDGAQVNTHHGRTVAKKSSWSSDNPISAKAGRSQVHAQGDRLPHVQSLPDPHVDPGEKQHLGSLHSKGGQPPRADRQGQRPAMAQPTLASNEQSSLPLTTKQERAEAGVTSEQTVTSSNKTRPEEASEVGQSTLQRKNSKNAAIQTEKRTMPANEVNTKSKKRSPFRKLPGK